MAKANHDVEMQEQRYKLAQVQAKLVNEDVPAAAASERGAEKSHGEWEQVEALRSRLEETEK